MNVTLLSNSSPQGQKANETLKPCLLQDNRLMKLANLISECEIKVADTVVTLTALSDC